MRLNGTTSLVGRASPGAPRPAARTGPRRRVRRTRPTFHCLGHAFTLLELLIVLAIIGLLAAITLPAISNIRKNNTMVSAGRQLVDDLALARARAISDRTTVYVVFISSDLLPQTFNLNTKDGKLSERLKSGLYTTYALFAERSVGDQPGRRRPRFLTSWRSLPDGILIATNKLWNNQALIVSADEWVRTFDYADFPFPAGASATVQGLPYLAFDFQGRLVNKQSQVQLNGEIIPLARGSILYSRASNGALLDIDVRESPPGNASDTNTFHLVRIDGLTGRARVDTRAIY
jgi:prepilin-type N-terminal cleavage/methylation domain-containing protein